MKRNKAPKTAIDLKEEAQGLIELLLKCHTELSINVFNVVKVSPDSLAEDILSSHLLDIYHMGYDDCIKQLAHSKIKNPL